MFSGGTGTQADPYLIATAEDLNDVRNYLSSHFLQIADIDLSEYANWEPIGTDTNPFIGSYDGGNFRITNLYINKSNVDNIGLFGYLSGILVNIRLSGNLYVDTCNVVGSLVGGTPRNNNTRINNCSFHGTLEAINSMFIGGLIGTINGGFETNNLSAICDLILDTCITVGGLGGGALGAVFTNSYHVGRITLKGHCREIGGFMGYTPSATTNFCYHIGDILSLDSVQSESIGGFVGYSLGRTFECFSSGNVNVNAINVGGFVGSARSSALGNTEIRDCYSIGSIGGNSFVGGFIGNLSLFSNIHENIVRCYCVGVIDGISNFNPFVGGSDWQEELSDDLVKDCYYDYDIETETDDYAIPKTTFEMKQQSTFEDWDFDTVWGINPIINDGYPYLRWNVSNGDGTIENPFLIWTPEDLDNVRNNLSAHYLQMADIDLSEYENWLPIANEEYFLGSYNGNNFKITNLHIDRPLDNSVGLFGKLGGVPLHSFPNNYIKNCHVQGYVRGYSMVGGLCGSVSPDEYYRENLFYNCSFKGMVEGNDFVGGLFGVSITSMIYCYSEANVRASSGVCGGLVGSLSSFGYTRYIKYCYANSNVEGGGCVGGLFGYANYIPIIENCYFIGDIYFNSLNYGNSGGLLGESKSLISNCYAIPNITAPSNLIDYAGGLVGKYDDDYYSDNCYHSWIKDDYAIAKNHTQLKQQSTFINWNFDTIWGIDPEINDGYPYLLWLHGRINLWVKTASNILKKAIKMVVIDTPTTIKEIKKLNTITNTGLK